MSKQNILPELTILSWRNTFFGLIGDMINHKARSVHYRGHLYSAQGMLENTVRILETWAEHPEESGEGALQIWLKGKNENNLALNYATLSDDSINDLRELLLICQALFIPKAFMAEPLVSINEVIAILEAAI